MNDERRSLGLTSIGKVYRQGCSSAPRNLERAHREMRGWAVAVHQLRPPKST